MKTSINFIIHGLLIIFFTWSITACQPKKPAGITSADKAAIREAFDKGMPMFRELNKNNASTFVKFLYAEDAIIFPPNAQPIKGQEAIIKLLQNYPPVPDYKHESEEIDGSGYLAYIRDTWSVTMNPMGMAAYKDSGTIVQIWRKQNDKSWKLWREIWHSDIPVPITPPVKP